MVGMLDDGVDRSVYMCDDCDVLSIDLVVYVVDSDEE